MFLSFNPNNETALKFAAEDIDEKDELLKKDLPLRYTWAIWEQIMQSSDGKAAQYSDATHKVASYSTVQDFWKLCSVASGFLAL